MSIKNDNTWSELNKALLEGIKNKDYSTMRGCYNDMAYLVAEEGKEAAHLLRERNKCELLALRETGIKKVKILTAHNESVCKKCAVLEGKVLAIDEALESMPIPACDCSTDVFGHGKSFCRCIYLPLIDTK